MDFVPMLAAVAFIWKLVDFYKYLRARDIDSAVTQLIVWGAGIGITFLLAVSDFAAGISIADTSLGSLNNASLILFGLSVGSTASAFVDVKKAVDNTDSAVVPHAP